MSKPEAVERKVLQSIEALRVTKELFFSDWYQRSVADLGFKEDTRQMFERIGRETKQERDELLGVARQWSNMAGQDLYDEGVKRVLRTNRKQFLLALIDAKDAAGEGIEKAALLAPIPLRQRMLELAAIDFRHANELRQALFREALDDELVTQDQAGQGGRST